jgi:hypothetical protein
MCCHVGCRASGYRSRKEFSVSAPDTHSGRHRIETVFSNRGTHVKPILFCFAVTAAAWSMVLYVIGA